VFFASDGSARSVAEVYRRFAAKIEGSAPIAVPRAIPKTPAAPTGADAARARMAYMLLTELGGS
jgi:hypothetical protein